MTETTKEELSMFSVCLSVDCLFTIIDITEKRKAATSP